MPRTPYLALLFAAVLAMGALNQLALRFFWYWLFWWFDILVHFIGGFSVGLATLLLALHSPLGKRLTAPHHPLLITAISVMVVALLWEYFEYRIGIISLPAELLDSTLDVFTGLAGGLLAYLLVIRGRKIRDTKYEIQA